MKNFFFYCISFLLLSTSVFAQIQVVSTSPINGSYNVGVGQTISITFNEPLDTTMNFNEQMFIINNIHLNGEGTYEYSSDHKTISFTAATVANKDYSFCFYGLRSQTGDTLLEPYLYRFTTEAEFNGVSISGNVASCDTTVNLGNTMISLLSGNVEDDSSRPVLVTLANQDGSYVLPYVKNGTYFGIAINDKNNSGDIGDGDLIAFKDSIVVQGTDIDNLDYNFPCPVYYTFPEIVTKVDSFANTVIPNYSSFSIMFVNANDISSDGNISNYDFFYRNMFDHTNWYRISFDSFSPEYFDYETDDFSDWFWDVTVPVGNSVFSAISPESIVLQAEQNGGAEIRQHYIPEGYCLETRLDLGQLGSHGYYDIVPNPNDIYWGVYYSIHQEDNWDSTLAVFRVIADYQTGEILVVDDVENGDKVVPENFELSQNYPNPFSKSAGNNSTTTIKYSVPRSQYVTLTVYNILGQKVSTLVNEIKTPGSYVVKFNVAQLPSGIYFYRLQSGNFLTTRKMILMK